MKQIIVIIFLLNAFLYNKSLGQREFHINVLNPPKKVIPGGHFTLFFELENLEKNQKIVEESLILPDNWQIILSKKLDKDFENPKYLYTVSTSTTSISGKYPLTFVVTNNDGTKVSTQFIIEVVNYRKIEIVPLSSYEYVREGDSLHLEYLIHNSGNINEKVKLRTTRGKIQLKYDTLTIEPNKSIQVRISQIVPKTQSNYWLMSNDLYVTMRDSINPVINFTSVPVYSNQSKKNDAYLRFPIEVGIWYSHFGTSRGVSTSYQFDIRGSGYLDFKKTHHLDFTVHGPNQINLPTLGNYDQYTLNYSYKNKTNVNLGDYLLSFNNLMEFGRFGRGLRIEQKLKHTGFSMFYLQPRFFPNQRETYGGSFYLKPKENLKYSIDFLSKKSKYDKDWFISKFIGLTANYQTNSLFLTSEATVSFANNKIDFGLFNRVYYHFKKLNINSDIVYAGKNFHGFYNNSWQSVNSVNYYIFKKLSLGAQSNFTRVNPSYDFSTLNTSPYYSNNSFILNYDIKPSTRLMLSYNFEGKEDKQRIKQFYFREQYARVAYLINSPKFNLWSETRVGQAKNLLVSTDDFRSTQSIRSVVQPQAKVLPWLWLGTFFEYQRNAKFSNTNQLTNYFYYGGTSRVTLGKTFNASFSYRNNYAPDELVQKRSFVDLTAELELKSHKISVVAGRAFIPNYSQTNENNLFFMLKYSLKLNTPIRKNKHLGSIKGHISGPSNVKKDGILIRLGDKKFLTDENGNFYFNDLVPDKYYITLDKSTIKSGIVTDKKGPIEVEVVAKGINEISIPLVNSGGISGKIIAQNNDSNNTNTTNKKNPVILVKLFNEQENFITKVNANSEFSFSEMKPGSWKVEALIQGNQDKFVIENPSQNIIIESEKLKELSFTMLPKERKIYFSNINVQLRSKE
ncbi:hypothetical protein [Emticicia sp.]|uniref:COG1470 family protein n=1 Tax=Emticicia sp. TaxID=1930953 RepID=UPI00375168C6